jgi:hypothetical protein
MHDHPIFPASDDLARSLAPVFEAPLYDESRKLAVCRQFCGISTEHAAAVRVLAANGLFTSAIVVHRSQFEALLRAVWLFYAASDGQLEKLSAELTPEHEQSSKNLPLAKDMLANLAKVPAAAIPYEALAEFKQYSWQALNSYVHAGIHPLARSVGGYPTQLIVQLVKVSNALSVVAGMQVAILTGRQQLVRQVRDLHLPYKECLPDHRSGGA